MLFYMNTLPENTFDLKWAIALAKEAGAIGLRYYRHTRSERKADNTVVTEADRAIEAFLVEEIRRRYPQDGILGEENINYQRQAVAQWILDPIDGTSMFAAGMPIWCVSIGYMVDNQLRAGVVYLPVVNDCFAVDLNGPATCNGQAIRVASPAAIDNETTLIASADTHRIWETTFPGKIRALGSCAAHGCYVAQGSVIGAVNSRTALWDVAGIIPIMERAGATVTLFDGTPLPIIDMLDGRKAPQPLVMASDHYAKVIRRTLKPKQKK